LDLRLNKWVKDKLRMINQLHLIVHFFPIPVHTYITFMYPFMKTERKSICILWPYILSGRNPGLEGGEGQFVILQKLKILIQAIIRDLNIISGPESIHQRHARLYPIKSFLFICILCRHLMLVTVQQVVAAKRGTIKCIHTCTQNNP